MSVLNRFGNMNPPQELMDHPYRMAVEPFCIKGNLYFVGNIQYSTLLIDTGAGLILLDVPPTELMPYTLNNIWKLGFDPRDVELIVISHAHVDHYGSVNAFRSVTGAEVLLSRVDADDMVARHEWFVEHSKHMGYGNELFVPDRLLEDGEVIELGNTKMRCVLIPGHTRGTMAHFWDVVDGAKTYHAGIYGGAGFLTLSDEMIKECELTPQIRKDFSDSIDKVWDEPVDIMLGNHPFHADTWKKRAAQKAGDADAFVDPEEWHRFLQELKDSYAAYLTLSQEEIAEIFAESDFEKYVGCYLD